MLKRILVATDASDYSRRALMMAIDLAKKFDAEIELVHVFTQPLPYSGDYLVGYSYVYPAEQIDDIGKQVLEVTLKGIDTQQVRIMKKIISGYPATSILQEIKRDIDLVVMGTRGHGPLAGAVMGSVTQRVLAESPCPVLIVK